MITYCCLADRNVFIIKAEQKIMAQALVTSYKQTAYQFAQGNWPQENAFRFDQVQNST